MTTTKPLITEEQFGQLERNLMVQIEYQFREITQGRISEVGKQRLADFLNELISDETDEAYEPGGAA
jgi:hypothetical protein